MTIKQLQKELEELKEMNKRFFNAQFKLELPDHDCKAEKCKVCAGYVGAI